MVIAAELQKANLRCPADVSTGGSRELYVTALTGYIYMSIHCFISASGVPISVALLNLVSTKKGEKIG